jgi:hypothetical protein
MSARTLKPLDVRNVQARADSLRRRADFIEGQPFPDPRNVELIERGIELNWRQKVARNEISRGQQLVLAGFDPAHCWNPTDDGKRCGFCFGCEKLTDPDLDLPTFLRPQAGEPR